jgi:hypothetical protein
MTQYEAAVRADKLIELLITHQPALFGTSHGLDDPENVATKLAQLRNALYVKLLPQAGQGD